MRPRQLRWDEGGFHREREIGDDGWLKYGGR